MFGYLRPFKAELKIREFVRYRAVYCGICKTISREYGQLPRLATNYEMTFLALLLLAVDERDNETALGSCILHPTRKSPMLEAHPLLDFTAAVAVLMLRYKLLDNVEDKEHIVLSRSAVLALARAGRKAARQFPEVEAIIKRELRALSLIEKADSQTGILPQCAAEPFGRLLAALLSELPFEAKAPEELRLPLLVLGNALGQWIYLIDAADDLPQDLERQNFNPLISPGMQDRVRDLKTAAEEGRETALVLLKQCEKEMDMAAELLPFKRDASIICNIIRWGLPAVREAVLEGKDLPKV